VRAPNKKIGGFCELNYNAAGVVESLTMNDVTLSSVTHSASEELDTPLVR